MEGKKVMMCEIDEHGVWGIGYRSGKGTTAVAVPLEDYSKAREALVWIIDNHAEDTAVPFCRECGAAGGRWPCATNLEAKAALSLLPEVPQ